MKKIVILACIAMALSCKTADNSPTIKNKEKTEQEKNKETPDNRSEVEKLGATLQGEYLVSQIKKEYLEVAPFNSWFYQSYKNYSPDEKVIEQIKPLISKGITIKGFVGTWCGDSKREIPHLYKILEMAGFDCKKKLTMIGLDRSKKSPKAEEQGQNIDNVPTFIFYKKGKEIGRFVEYSALGTTEKDILSILKEEGYKNPYQN